MEPEAEIIRAQLFALRDEAYRTFHSALMPTVPPETVIGVRVPTLRKLAKQLAGTAQAYRPCRMDTTKRTTSTRF